MNFIKSSIVFFFLFVTNSYSQVLGVEDWSTIVLEADETILFSGDTLLIENLTMEEGSKIKFLSDVYVEVKNANLGKDTSFDLSGIDGIAGKYGNKYKKDGLNGKDATNGNDITLVISLESLESFSIKSNGGNGGKGGGGYSPRRNIVHGMRGDSGGSGGRGGAAGNAGDIFLYYHSPSFLPLFNRKGKNSIFLETKSGKCGEAGRPGKGGLGGEEVVVVDPSTNQLVVVQAEGSRGQNGGSNGLCINGKDGKTLIKKVKVVDTD